MPQMKLLSTDVCDDVGFNCRFKFFDFGRLMKFIGNRKTWFGSHPDTYLLAKWEISGAWGEIPFCKSYLEAEKRDVLINTTIISHFSMLKWLETFRIWHWYTARNDDVKYLIFSTLPVFHVDMDDITGWVNRIVKLFTTNYHLQEASDWCYTHTHIISIFLLPKLFE